MLPFEKRKDLTKFEKIALRCYRDLDYLQHVWSFKLKNKRPNTDCDMINGFLRGTIAKTKFKLKDLRILRSLILRIFKAIKKSGVDCDTLTVYKGVSYYSELKRYVVGKTVIDKAFNSFTASEKKALEYSRKNKQGERIILALDLKKGDKAIYMDDVENEWLIQKNRKYLVIKIAHYVDSVPWGKAIIYYLRLI